MGIVNDSVLAVIFYIVGFFGNKIGMGPQNYLILAPKWLFYICGVPRSTRYPVRVLSFIGTQMEMMGSILLVFNFFWYIILKQSTGGALGFLGSYFLSFCIVHYIKKLYPYDVTKFQ